MMDYWEVSRKRFSGFPALRHSITGELDFFGARGRVWLKNDTVLVFIEYRSVNETLGFQPIENIEKLFSKLQIPRLSGVQQGYATTYQNNEHLENL